MTIYELLKNIINKLNLAVRIDSQNLTDKQKKQAMNNIGAYKAIPDKSWNSHKEFSNGFAGTIVARAAASYALAVRNGTDNIIHINDGTVLPFTDISLAPNGLRIRNADGEGVADCSIYGGMVLRGMDYDHSPYAIHKQPNETWTPSEELPHMYADWGIVALDKQSEGKYNNIGIDGYSTIRYVADMVSYFRDNAYIVFDADVDGIATSELLNKLEPGDVIFQKDAESESTRVVHMLIVSERKDRAWECSHGFSPQMNYAMTSTRLPNIRLVVRPDYRGDMEKRIQNMFLYSPTYNEVPYGANLMSYPWRFSGSAGTYSENGITMTFTSMNTIHLEGTSTGDISLSVTGLQNTDGIKLPAGTYRISGMTGTGVQSVYFALQVKKLDNTELATKIRCYDGNDNIEFTLTEPEEVIVKLYIGNGYTLNCDITPKLERLS